MKTCTTCATQYGDGAAACPSCGTTTFVPTDAGDVTAAHDELPPSPLGDAPAPAPPATTGPTGDERNWGMIGHLAAFAGFTAIPFAHVLGPLAVWLMKRDESEYVRRHALESLNFNISITIWAALAGLTLFIAIGIILLPLVLLFWFVVTIVAAIKASNGEEYRYPATFRWVS